MPGSIPPCGGKAGVLNSEVDNGDGSGMSSPPLLGPKMKTENRKPNIAALSAGRRPDVFNPATMVFSEFVDSFETYKDVGWPDEGCQQKTSPQKDLPIPT